MNIDFYTIPEQALDRFKGGEGTFFARILDTADGRFIKGRLPAGASIGYHCHTSDKEIISIESGAGSVLFEGNLQPLRAGDCHLCPTGSSHSLINTGTDDLCFFATVVR